MLLPWLSICLPVWQLFSLQCISCPMSYSPSLIPPMWPVSAYVDVTHCSILKQQYRLLPRSCSLPAAFLETMSAQLKSESTLWCLPTLTKASLSFYTILLPKLKIVYFKVDIWRTFQSFFLLFSLPLLLLFLCAVWVCCLSTAELQLLPTPPTVQHGPTMQNFILLVIFNSDIY